MKWKNETNRMVRKTDWLIMFVVLIGWIFLFSAASIRMDHLSDRIETLEASNAVLVKELAEVKTCSELATNQMAILNSINGLNTNLVEIGLDGVLYRPHKMPKVKKPQKISIEVLDLKAKEPEK